MDGERAKPRRIAWAAAVLACCALTATAWVVLAQDGVVDINTASASQLQTLPGIGPVKAEAIIRYRQEHGGFEHPAELLNVSGIGRRTLSNFCHRVEAHGQRGCDDDGRLNTPAAVLMPALDESGLLNINLASADELQVLPRIGPALSERIVNFRTAHGPFTTVEELTEVHGIGPATLDQVRDFVTVQTNVNVATVQALVQLGVPADEAGAIVDYRERRGYFDDVDELMAVPGVDGATVEQLRPILVASRPPRD